MSDRLDAERESARLTTITDWIAGKQPHRTEGGWRWYCARREDAAANELPQPVFDELRCEWFFPSEFAARGAATEAAIRSGYWPWLERCPAGCSETGYDDAPGFPGGHRCNVCNNPPSGHGGWVKRKPKGEGDGGQA